MENTTSLLYLVCCLGSVSDVLIIYSTEITTTTTKI
jgi:hypothetical protein